MQGKPQRQLFGGDVDGDAGTGRRLDSGGGLALRRRRQRGGPAAFLQGRDPRGPAVLRNLRGGDPAQAVECLVHFVGAAHLRPGFGTHRLDRAGIERAQVGGVLAGVPAAGGLGAAFLQRRVVEERVGGGGEHFAGQRAGAGEVACDHVDLARLQAAQDAQQAVQVHRLAQAVVQGLADQRVVGNLALADDVLQAGDLVGEHGGEQVLAAHALDLRRGLLAAAEARQRQCGHGIPAPARAEQRRVEQGLGQHVVGAGRVQVARHLDQRKAVAGGQRQHDRILGGGRLQLEVELATEALAQGQPPRPVDPAAERRVDHQLGAAGLVEEALEHDGRLGRQHAQRGLGGGQVAGQLLRGGFAQAQRVAQPRHGARHTRAPLSRWERGWGRGFG